MKKLRDESTNAGKKIWSDVDAAAERAPKWIKKNAGIVIESSNKTGDFMKHECNGTVQKRPFHTTIQYNTKECPMCKQLETNRVLFNKAFNSENNLETAKKRIDHLHLSTVIFSILIITSLIIGALVFYNLSSELSKYKAKSEKYEEAFNKAGSERDECLKALEDKDTSILEMQRSLAGYRRPRS